MATVTASCEKRRARIEGANREGGERIVSDRDRGRKVKVRRYNKHRADDMLGQLNSHLRHVMAALDTDVTESSSGGDSADELDKFSVGAVKYAPIEERARYRWLSRRGELAARWVWLQAQVSDLEYKIRQHTEMYRTQRAGKGGVVLGEEVISWPLHAKVPATATAAAELPLDCRPVTKVYQRASKNVTGKS